MSSQEELLARNDPPDKSRPPRPKPPPMTRENAVIFNTVPEITSIEYAIAITSMVGKSNTIYCARISKGRALAYLRTPEMAEELSMTGFEINNTQVNVERLTRSSEKFIISNITPEVPNEFLKQLLSQFAKLTSEITEIYSNPNEEQEALLGGPIFIFKRQFYALLEKELPDRINFKYNNQSYVIFLEKSNSKFCNFCDKRGHNVENCYRKRDQDRENAVRENLNENRPSNEQTYAQIVSSEFDTSLNKSDNSPASENTASTPKNTNTNKSIGEWADTATPTGSQVLNISRIKNNIAQNNTPIIPAKNKRTASASQTPPGRINLDENTIKKHKTSPVESTGEKMPLSPNKLNVFLEEIKHKKKPKQHAAKFTTDLVSLVKQIAGRIPTERDFAEKTRLIMPVENLKEP